MNQDNNNIPEKSPNTPDGSRVEDIKEDKKELERISEKEEKNPAHKQRRAGLNFGQLLLGLAVTVAGLLLLARSTGVLPEGFEVDILRFWPILVIALGLSFLDTRTPLSFAVALAVFLGVLILVGAVIWNGNQRSTGESQENPFSIEKDADVFLAKVQAKMDVGEVKISGGAEKLAEGKFISGRARLMSISSSAGEVQDVRIEAENFSGWNPFRGNVQNSLEMRLSSGLPMELFFDFDVVSGRINLADVMARSIDVKSDVSDLEIVLPANMEAVNLKVDNNVGQLSIVVPASAGARAVVRSNISSEDIIGFERVGDNEYRTSDYDSASNKIEMDMDIDVSSLRIERR